MTTHLKLEYLETGIFNQKHEFFYSACFGCCFGKIISFAFIMVWEKYNTVYLLEVIFE